ncbi:glycine/betaine ABC transporter substrate-binding protein, partial [Klebsiella pneumoniae]|nr:glycine/betaine ABC transporter substrate-binding protein [Klebsiella pneumoniae]
DFTSGSTPTIFGIDSGSSLMGVTAKAKDLYQLDYNVLPSSESAMLLALERAVKRNEPVVVTLWKPHWVWAKHKLRYLKDPKGIYGKADAIYGISSKTFKADHAEVERWMQQWKM